MEVGTLADYREHGGLKIKNLCFLAQLNIPPMLSSYIAFFNLHRENIVDVIQGTLVQ